jgi:glycosyltransferase involved in cell wall biosynthesis
MKNPLVSVVIPAFNSSDFISETIQSVLNQTYTNTEIIVVDDGSTDNTYAIAEEYSRSDQRIKVFKIPPAGRPSVPRNYGISKSRGDLIAFLDSDDLWTPDKLSAQVKVFEKNPSLLLVYSSSYSFGEVNLFSPNYELLPLWFRAAKNRNDLLKIGNTIPLSSVLIRKDILTELKGFDEDPALKIEDYELWLRVSEKGNIHYIPRVHVYYRIHKSQFSADWDTKKERVEYLSQKSGVTLPSFKPYRKKGGILLLVRNIVHFKSYLFLRLLGLFDRNNG